MNLKDKFVLPEIGLHFWVIGDRDTIFSSAMLLEKN